MHGSSSPLRVGVARKWYPKTEKYEYDDNKNDRGAYVGTITEIEFHVLANEITNQLTLCEEPGRRVRNSSTKRVIGQLRAITLFLRVRSCMDYDKYPSLSRSPSVSYCTVSY